MTDNDKWYLINNSSNHQEVSMNCPQTMGYSNSDGIAPINRNKKFACEMET